jgi:hypothetical protein
VLESLLLLLPDRRGEGLGGTPTTRVGFDIWFESCWPVDGREEKTFFAVDKVASL